MAISNAITTAIFPELTEPRIASPIASPPALFTPTSSSTTSMYLAKSGRTSRWIASIESFVFPAPFSAITASNFVTNAPRAAFVLSNAARSFSDAISFS